MWFESCLFIIMQVPFLGLSLGLLEMIMWFLYLFGKGLFMLFLVSVQQAIVEVFNVSMRDSSLDLSLKPLTFKVKMFRSGVVFGLIVLLVVMLVGVFCIVVLVIN